MKQEFSNIIRRAFATRLFPPEVVDKLGKCIRQLMYIIYILNEETGNFAFYMYMYMYIYLGMYLCLNATMYIVFISQMSPQFAAYFKVSVILTL